MLHAYWLDVLDNVNVGYGEISRGSFHRSSGQSKRVQDLNEPVSRKNFSQKRKPFLLINCGLSPMTHDPDELAYGVTMCGHTHTHTHICTNAHIYLPP